MPEDFKFDVFLSHSAKDKPVVRELAALLQRDGLRVWLDEEQIKPGDSIPAKIEEGLERSHVLVLCMSVNAFGSDWAQLEAGTFRFRDPLNKERRFIPLRLDVAPIKGSLAQFLFVDWCSAEREKEYAKLLQGCRPFALENTKKLVQCDLSGLVNSRLNWLTTPPVGIVTLGGINYRILNKEMAVVHTANLDDSVLTRTIDLDSVICPNVCELHFLLNGNWVDQSENGQVGFVLLRYSDCTGRNVPLVRNQTIAETWDYDDHIFGTNAIEPPFDVEWKKVYSERQIRSPRPRGGSPEAKGFLYALSIKTESGKKLQSVKIVEDSRKAGIILTALTLVVFEDESAIKVSEPKPQAHFDTPSINTLNAPEKDSEKPFITASAYGAVLGSSENIKRSENVEQYSREITYKPGLLSKLIGGKHVKERSIGRRQESMTKTISKRWAFGGVVAIALSVGIWKAAYREKGASKDLSRPVPPANSAPKHPVKLEFATTTEPALDVPKNQVVDYSEIPGLEFSDLRDATIEDGWAAAINTALSREAIFRSVPQQDAQIEPSQLAERIAATGGVTNLLNFESLTGSYTAKSSKAVRIKVAYAVGGIGSDHIYDCILNQEATIFVLLDKRPAVIVGEKIIPAGQQDLQVLWIKTFEPLLYADRKFGWHQATNFEREVIGHIRITLVKEPSVHN